MKEIEFNLLTEPWVRVRRPDNTVQEVSLTDALLHAQDYVDLAGEMPTQDAAMLRLLLAVLFTVFSRVNGKVSQNRLKKRMMLWLAGEICGSWGISRSSRCGTIWNSGKTASGCSTRHIPSGRCRGLKSGQPAARRCSTAK